MPEPRMQIWLDTIQESGCRLTGPRYIVAEVLALSEKALSPQEIYEQARIRYPTLGLVSVYRTLETLEELGLIQRLHQPDKCQAYIAAFSGHEHVLICSKCGLVEFFQGDDLSLLVKRVELDTGYQIGDHWLQFFGLCRKCQPVKLDENAHI